MRIVFDIIKVLPYKTQPYKVSIYEDNIFTQLLWMKASDLERNVNLCEGRGDEAEIKKSYLEKDNG